MAHPFDSAVNQDAPPSFRYQPITDSKQSDDKYERLNRAMGTNYNDSEFSVCSCGVGGAKELYCNQPPGGSPVLESPKVAHFYLQRTEEDFIIIVPDFATDGSFFESFVLRVLTH